MTELKRKGIRNKINISYDKTVKERREEKERLEMESMSNIKKAVSGIFTPIAERFIEKK